MVTVEEWRKRVYTDLTTLFKNNTVLEGRINNLYSEIVTLEAKNNHLQDELRKLRDKTLKA